MCVVLLITGTILRMLQNGLTQLYLVYVSNAAVCYVLHRVWDRVLIYRKIKLISSRLSNLIFRVSGSFG
jgi:hypothetical protein